MNITTKLTKLQAIGLRRTLPSVSGVEYCFCRQLEISLDFRALRLWRKLLMPIRDSLLHHGSGSSIERLLKAKNQA